MINYKQGQHIVKALCPEHFLIKARSGGYPVCPTCINELRLQFNTSLEGLLEYSIHKAVLALKKKAVLLEAAEIFLWESSHDGLLGKITKCSTYAEKKIPSLLKITSLKNASAFTICVPASEHTEEL